jgi:hypothetical protein
VQGFWPTGATVLSAMANFDHFTGAKTYQSTVTSALNKAFSLYANFDEVRGAAHVAAGLTPRAVPVQRRRAVVGHGRVLRVPRVRGHEPAQPRDRELEPRLAVVRPAPSSIPRVAADAGASQITAAIAASGKMSGKGFAVKGSCGGGASLRPRAAAQG